MMRNERIELWTKEEYQYPAAYGFLPVMFSCIHEDTKKHPAILIVPGGSYREVSPSEAHLSAMEFYQTGYNVFVLAYTINLLDEAPLKLQPLNDISRAVRMIRFHAEELHSRADQIAICGFSAGGHLCASLCVHGKDVTDPDENYQSVSNRPDAVILAYPVISSGKYGHRDSFVALLGKNPTEQELDYMALENHVTGDTPPCFLWQTATDEVVPVQNSYLFAQACAKAGVPFAHHVFSEGVHGLSVATEEWFLQKTGHQKNQLGMIMGTGCVVVLLIQFIGYVLENLGHFPLSNNYCLFLTTGGSGMMISYIMFGILLSIYRYQNVLVEPEVKKKEISV